MSSESQIASTLLAGFTFGMFAGIAGIIARRVLASRVGLSVALIIGVLVGGAAGMAATSLLRGETHKPTLIASSGVVGAMLPWVVTWRVFQTNDESESVTNEQQPPASA